MTRYRLDVRPRTLTPAVAVGGALAAETVGWVLFGLGYAVGDYVPLMLLGLWFLVAGLGYALVDAELVPVDEAGSENPPSSEVLEPDVRAGRR